MAINRQLISQTIIKLMQAGKKMPQEIDRSKLLEVETRRILKETVELWYEIFSQQAIGPDRWEQAEYIALTMTGAQGLNVNIISPALMQAALKQAEENHIQENMARNEQYKQEESAFGCKLPRSVNQMLLVWTADKLKHRRLICPYMPTAEQLSDAVSKIGLTEEEYAEQYQLLRAHLSDRNYAKETGERVASKLTFNKVTRELTLTVV